MPLGVSELSIDGARFSVVSLGADLVTDRQSPSHDEDFGVWTSRWLYLSVELSRRPWVGVGNSRRYM